MEIKTSNITASYFKNEDRNPLVIYSGNEVWDYHRKPYESNFEYSLFQLYCFYDYSIEDLYNLIQEISSKYSKNDLYHLGYSDFVQYVEIKRFDMRKETYRRSSDEYKGKANLVVENGQELLIVHVGKAFISSGSKLLTLNNVLHVPLIIKPLLSVKKFNHDNNYFFEFHPNHCLVKDHMTKRLVL